MSDLTSHAATVSRRRPGSPPFPSPTVPPAFSAVYSARLVYVPRHVADPEGGPVARLIRDALSLAAVALDLAGCCS